MRESRPWVLEAKDGKVTKLATQGRSTRQPTKKPNVG